MSFGGYGTQLKNDYRRLYGATVGFAGRGEMIPNKDSYCEIDPHVVDKWGIPVLRFHFKWSDHEINQAKHMQETFRAIIQEMGGTPIGDDADARAAATGSTTGGRIIHELGVTRMGNDPTTSVLNQQLPGARREEPVRRRRRAVRLAGRQEPHLDDPRALDAHERVHRRRAQDRARSSR